jgi:hypothetical protein
MMTEGLPGCADEAPVLGAGPERVRCASTRPAAWPRRITKSGVIGDSPTLPRTPSVPKYRLTIIALPSILPLAHSLSRQAGH